MLQTILPEPPPGDAGNAGPGGAPPTRFPIRYARRLRLGNVGSTLFILAGIVAAFGTHRLEPRLGPLAPWAPVALLVAALVPLSRRFFARPRGTVAIELEAEHVILPRDVDDPRLERIPLRDVEVLWSESRPNGRGFVYLSAHRHVFAFPFSAFVEPMLAPQLPVLLRARIAALPGGDAQLQRLDARARAADLALRVQPKVMPTMAAVLTLVYLVEWHLGADLDPFALVRLGANASVLVEQGQWYRLASANFLHSGWVHIATNLSGLLGLGLTVERLMGRTRVLIVYLLSALAGAAASAWAALAPVSVGASTAVFGLVGAFAFLAIRYRKVMPAGFEVPSATWLVFLGANALLTLLVPEVDLVAHVGGFVAGVAATALVTVGCEQLPIRRTPLPIRGLALGLMCLFLAGLSRATTRAASGDPDDELAVAATQSREVLNNFAWSIAIEPEPEIDRLWSAERASVLAMEGAFSSPEEEDAFRDTRALVLFRLGEKARAIELEAENVRRSGKDFYATQLLRFLDGQSAPRLATEASGAVSASFDPMREEIVLSRERLPPGPTTVYLVVRREGRLFALLAYPIDPSDGLEVHRSARAHRVGEEQWPAGTTVEVGLVAESRDPEGAWLADPEALALPR